MDKFMFFLFLILEPDVNKCVKKGGGHVVCSSVTNKGCVVTFKTSKYSHLSNKRKVTITDFKKFHPPQKKIHPPCLLIS